MSDSEPILNIETVDGVTVVSFSTASICGISGVDELAAQLRDYIAAEQPKKMVVDFEGVRFFSSQVLGMLVDAWRRLKDYNGRVLISGIDPQLSRVFKITNLDRIFEFYPDKSSAVEALKGD